jgi:hypothetical protein
VFDSDPANRFVWRTSTVAPGHYFLWSYIDEPPQENADFLAFQAPFVITVERDGLLGPTVMLRRPEALTSASGRYLLAYAACDPTGTARVRLEAAPESRPEDYQLIADELPAVESGTIAWDTRALSVERWVVRAQIRDRCGHLFASHARAFIEVRPPLDPYDGGPPDVIAAGPWDAASGGGAACNGRPDAGAPDAAVGAPDATAAPCADAECGDGGCACASSGGSGVSALLALLSCIALRGRRRRR